MGIQGMKVHRFAGGGFWEHHEHPPSALRCKRLRPLVPRLSSPGTAASHLKSFIKPQSGPGKPSSPSSDSHRKESSSQVQVEGQGGGTRWNPTQEQIGYLEMLYKGGIRTPNAQQIDHITAHLAKYGKIEGKNVFYWFQNHKARDRQKQKRISLQNPTTTTATKGELVLEGDAVYKGKVLEEESRYCTAVEEGGIRTLELFPLHPEGRLS